MAPAPREAVAVVTAPVTGAKSRSTVVPPPSFVRNDPKVSEVLDAQDSYSAYWKDLDRVFKARSKFDESKYVQTVLAATVDYLELPENGRVAFSQAAQSAAVGVAQARKDYDAARKALPPKDKANPATYTAYQQQKDGIDARYQEQVKVAVESLKVALDPNRPRHAEFASNAEKWLRNIAPRPSQP